MATAECTSSRNRIHTTPTLRTHRTKPHHTSLTPHSTSHRLTPHHTPHHTTHRLIQSVAATCRLSRRFDLGGFLEAIDGAMVPVALNLFYARAKEEDDDDDDERPTSSTSSSTPPPPAALEPPFVPQGSGARGLGAAWKSRPADGAHDEL